MSLSQYVDEICNRDDLRYSTLTPKEEKVLAIQAKSDPLAKTKFVEHNLRLVIAKVNREYKTKYGLSDDEQWELIQAGNIALEKSVDEFQVRDDKYIKFSSYFYNNSLKWSLNKALSQLRHIRLPSQIESLRKAIYCASKEYFLVNGKTPTEEELTKLITIEGVTVEKIRDANRVYLETIVTSTNKTLYDDSDTELSDTLIGSDGRDDTELENLDLKKILVTYMDNLPDLERIVLIEKYFHHLSIPEISSKLGITTTKISQREAKALRMIKSEMQKNTSLRKDLQISLRE